MTKVRLGSRFTYWLKLSAVGVRFAWTLPDIIRLSLEDARQIKILRSRLAAALRRGENRDDRWWVEWGMDLWRSLPRAIRPRHVARTCWHLARALPDIAGKAHVAYAQRVREMQVYYCDGKSASAPATFLRQPVALEFKRRQVVREFRQAFELNLLLPQAEAFSLYAYSGELFRDFLRFALSRPGVNDANLRAVLADSVPDFAFQVERRLAPERSRRAVGRARRWLQWLQCWAGDTCVVGHYSRTKTLFAAVPARTLTPRVRAEVERHVTRLDTVIITSSRTVLLCEAHVVCCVQLFAMQRAVAHADTGPLAHALERAGGNLSRAAGTSVTTVAVDTSLPRFSEG